MDLVEKEGEFKEIMCLSSLLVVTGISLIYIEK